MSGSSNPIDYQKKFGDFELRIITGSQMNTFHVVKS